MTTEEAVKELDAIAGPDSAFNHGRGDTILLEWIRVNGGKEVAEAWERAEERCHFWREDY